MNKAKLSIVMTLCFLLGGCSSTIKNRAPIGESFPAVIGTSLQEKVVHIPKDYEGQPVVLLVGYTQRSQFDLDRWILGLTQMGTPIRIVEVPTIAGLLPGMFADRIDAGMRTGIPKEDWGGVVTVYDDGDRIEAFLGTEGPNNGRILLLDQQGIVRWFWDRGYSATGVTKLHGAALKQLNDSGPNTE